MKDQIRQSIDNHFDQIMATTKERSFKLTELLQGMGNPSIMDFTVQTIHDDLKRAISKDERFNKVKRFDDYYVAISTVPTVGVAKIKTYFANGYSAFFDNMIKESDYSNGNVNLAHWVFCYDGGKESFVYFTFFPRLEYVQDDESDAIALIAEDLLTPDQRNALKISKSKKE